MSTPAAYSTLVCYREQDQESYQIAQTYQRARGRRAKLLGLTCDALANESATTLTRFRDQIQGPIFAEPRTRFVVLCRGIPWKLWSDDWKTQQSLDSNLTLPPEEGGGDLRPKGNPFQLDPTKVRSHPSFRFVSRIDGITAADCHNQIDNTIFAEQVGLNMKVAAMTGTSPFPPTEVLLEDRGWTVHHRTLPSWPEQTKLWLGYVQSPEAARFDLQNWARPWFGWATQSTGMAMWRALASWCPYCVRHGAVATIGATAEPTLAGFPAAHNVLLPFLQWGWTWAEAVWFATPLINHRVCPSGDPTWRMRRDTR